MDRRIAVAWMATAVLGGCGGGGGGGGAGGDSSAAASGSNAPAPAPAPAPVQAPAPSPSFSGPSSIAIWGDSLTPPVVANLRLLYPDRDILDGGVAGQTSPQIVARQLADAANRNAWINIFWYGHNNQDEPDQIKADIAASVATLLPGNTRFIVLGVVNQATATESRGGQGYQTIVQLNSELAARYGENYLDIRAHLVSQFNSGNGQDVADFQNDVPPSSMRFDQIHLNNDGSEAVARKLREFIDAKGW